MKVKRSVCLLSTLVGCALVLLAAANNTTDDCETTTSKPGPQKYVRLPTSVLPIHYNIKIHLYMIGSGATDFMFKGHVKIRISCVNATNNITLHAHVLKVETQTIRFYGESGTVSVPEYTGTEEDKDMQFFIIKLDRDMEAGKNYILEMNYTAPLEDNDDNGLFLKSYLRNNTPVYLAVTNFWPTGARKAFPCFDEPSFKAAFNITIIRPEKLVSTSNIFKRYQSRQIIVAGETYVEDNFNITPNMSTYAIGFVVSDFEKIYSTTEEGLWYRAWAPHETLSEMRNALNISVQIHDFFVGFFNISYTLPKLDMFAIPNFTSVAIGNWGLLTYSDELFKEGKNKEVTEEKLAINLALAACHQWFRGLVSPAWWDDNWVNEGLTTFLAYLAVDHIKPEWKIFEKFLSDRQFKALSADKGNTAFSLYRKVNYHKEIKEVFKDVIYNKAASIFRMLRHFLGYETFKKGVARYLDNFKFSSANHDELWSSLQQQALEDGKDTLRVKAIMDTWTLLEGSPLVKINTAGPYIEATQFISESTVNSYISNRHASDYTWQIPITFVTRDTKNFSVTDKDVYWLTTQNQTRFEQIQVERSESYWVCANVEMNGYYRVLYTTNAVPRIANKLRAKHEEIPVMTRAQIIYDAWNLVRENHVDMEYPFRMIRYMHREREYLPLATVTTEMVFASTLLESTDEAGNFTTFMKNKLNAPYKYFVTPHEAKRHDVLSTQMIIRGACYYGVQECRQNALADYRGLMKTGDFSSIEIDLLPIVLSFGIAAGGDDEWNYALEMYKNATRYQGYLPYALSYSTNDTILNYYLNLILANNSVINNRDGLTVIKYVAHRPQGRISAWNFFSTNFLAIKTKFGGNSGWPTIFNDVMSLLSTASERHEVYIFQNRSSVNLGTDIELVEEALRKVNNNVEFMNKHKVQINKWLFDNKD